jgi:hypothetical protein
MGIPTDLSLGALPLPAVCANSSMDGGMQLHVFHKRINLAGISNRSLFKHGKTCIFLHISLLYREPNN